MNNFSTLTKIVDIVLIADLPNEFKKKSGFLINKSLKKISFNS